MKWAHRPPNAAWAVLALALGLIAAAPYGFDWLAHREPYWEFRGPVLFYGSDSDIYGRSLSLRVGAFGGAFVSGTTGSLLVFTATVGPLPATTMLPLPNEYITLRVACALALAGVWGLVVCVRALRRSRQPSPERHL